MSEYLGWTERKPSTRPKGYGDSAVLPGGPVTHSYESYVKNIFHPANRLKKDKARGISASAMLQMERNFGKGALDEKYDKDDDYSLLKTPLESLYDELGLKSSETALYKNYPVYMPKQSSEYHALAHGTAEQRHSYDQSRGGYYSSYKDRQDEDYEKNNHKTLIDYKDFDSSPLSPYLYQSHPYIRSQDTRILGSNFVQVTSRPKDRFLEKIDQTLADVRAMPRYC